MADADELVELVLTRCGPDYALVQLVGTRLLTIAEARGHRHSQRIKEPPRIDAARRWLPRCRQMVELTADA